MTLNTSGITLEQLKTDKQLTYDIIDFFFGFKLHFYQLIFLMICLKYKRIAGKWCRQAGKSQIVSIYITLVSMIEKTSSIVVSPTQNQSNELFLKIKNLINDNKDITPLIKRETQTEIIFTNGSRIISLPCGPEGASIRGYTCDILVIEEAGIMKDLIVNTVLIPMLASKGHNGQIIKIGTPLIRNHFYRSCFEDTNYQVVNVIWQDCVKAGQYSRAFINEQRSELTTVEFQTEYEAEFIASNMMFFSPELLDDCVYTYIMLPKI